jgi:hypothetical protein
VSDDIEAVIREAALQPYIGHDAPPYEVNMLVGALAAAVRLLREPAELPAGWRATRWQAGNEYPAINLKPTGEFNAGIYHGDYHTLAEAIAAVEAARSSGR